jgi:hypothetical protein
MLTIFLAIAGLSVWLLNPLDQTAWRIKINVPWLGEVSVRSAPLLQIARSLPVGIVLDKLHWHSRLGVLWLQNTEAGFILHCLDCRIHWPALAKQPILFTKLSLAVSGEQYFSGWLTMHSGQTVTRIGYQGEQTAQGIKLVWSLPKTPLQDLLQALQTASPVFKHAKVTGTLAATGTLKWPSRHWSAKPDLQGFSVSGLGTEWLNSAELNYRCPTKSAIPRPPYSAWTSEKAMGRWLPKAVLLAEDAQFMQHPGYDLATLRYLLGQENHLQLLGGSTISQQLAKYFFTGGERHWLRKVEEVFKRPGIFDKHLAR